MCLKFVQEKNPKHSTEQQYTKLYSLCLNFIVY